MSQPQHFAPPPSASPLLARLGDDTGYRLAGDAVELHAHILCLAPLPDAAQWSLQLWADESIQVAALPLGPLRPGANGSVRVSGCAPALPPAGRSARSLSMALVCSQPQAAGTLQDRKVFAASQRFVQPLLEGRVEWRLYDGELLLELESIHNPRDAANLSGTLALELWSLDTPCDGGDWSGTPLASLVLGCLVGQQRWSQQRHPMRVSELPPGKHLTLMLREWTANGYVTRDWRQLAGPRPTSTAPVSLNRSTTAALRSVRGISDKVARTIVASRPFASVDELRRVRGMTSGLFERVREHFGL
ncbi:MAG: hypothetical protein RJA36_1222 [Pseudomonadota bacterium]|jgi:hypothetical protein